MHKSKRGITLVEVLVVTAIVASLAAVLWMVLAPAAKKRALQARVTSDLRQIADAINQYMGDDDDRYPLELWDLKTTDPGINLKPPTTRAEFPECDSGPGWYYFTQPERVVQGEKTYDAVFPFDPQSNPIVKAHFMCRLPGGTEGFTIVLPDGKQEHHAGPLRYDLGARLDGSVGWFDALEEWEIEYANRRKR